MNGSQDLVIPEGKHLQDLTKEKGKERPHGAVDGRAHETNEDDPPFPCVELDHTEQGHLTVTANKSSVYYLKVSFFVGTNVCYEKKLYSQTLSCVYY